MENTIIDSKKGTARFIGLLYLLVIICAGFSQGYVRANLIIPGNAASTASNILANEGLFRMGLVSDMIAFILDAIISILFYQLFKETNRTLALVSSGLRLIAHPAIGSLNLLNHYLAIHVLGDADYLSVFELSQLESLSLLFMDAHRYGYLIAGGFFGIHCLLLGTLIFKSNFIPRFFGVLMLIAGFTYLLETFGDFQYPGNEELLAWIVGLGAALGEVGFAFFLLFKGVKR